MSSSSSEETEDEAFPLICPHLNTPASCHFYVKLLEAISLYLVTFNHHVQQQWHAVELINRYTQAVCLHVSCV